jgi:hypothetical protein
MPLDGPTCCKVASVTTGGSRSNKITSITRTKLAPRNLQVNAGSIRFSTISGHIWTLPANYTTPIFSWYRHGRSRTREMQSQAETRHCGSLQDPADTPDYRKQTAWINVVTPARVYPAQNIFRSLRPSTACSCSSKLPRRFQAPWGSRFESCWADDLVTPPPMLATCSTSSSKVLEIAHGAAKTPGITAAHEKVG